MRVLCTNPEVFKVNPILHTLSRLKKELFSEGAQPDRLSEAGENHAAGDKERDEKMKQYVALSTQVPAADQFLKLKIEELQFESHRSAKKITPQGKQHSDRGFLLKSDAMLAFSTTGLHLHRLRSKKMTGGIFELIKLKQRLDALQRERGITASLDLPIPAV